MKTVLLAALTSFLLTSSATNSTTVYLCNNGSTEVYHINEECHGLKRCKHEVLELTIEEARKRGKRLCGYEKEK